MNFLLLFLHGRVLFEKLVEQHGVHRLVAHAVRLALAIARHQVRVHLPLARPVTLPSSVTGFYYSDRLIGSDITQFLPSPAWPFDGHGAHASCLTQSKMDRNIILRHIMLPSVFSILCF